MGKSTDDRLLGAPSQLLSGDDLKFKSGCYQISAMASKTRTREIGFIILCSAGSYVQVARVPNGKDSPLEQPPAAIIFKNGKDKHFEAKISLQT